MGRGRGKATPKNPASGGRVDRKVVLEYSSDETPDENAPQPAEGAEAPKRVKKQIHLTLPTGPAHVTTTETFATFFINHGLTRALQKAFAKKGWSTNQMREFVTNFQKKHGQQVPMPKIYGDEDSTDDEGPELADGTKAVKKKTTSGACGGDGPSTRGENVSRPKGKKRSRDNDGQDDDPNKRRKTGENAPPKPMVALKEPHKKTTGYPPIDRKLPVLYISRLKERTLRGEDAGETSEAPQVQSRDCGSTRHPPLPKDLSAAHPETAFPEVGEGDRPGLQDRPAVPVSGDTMSPRSGGGIPGQAVRRCQPVCHPRQASYHHAEGHTAGKTNLGRACVMSHNKHKHLGPFQDHPHTPKGVAFGKP